MSSWVRKEVIGDCTLYQGDCLQVMHNAVGADALVTDPPYGVNFSGKNTKHTTRRNDGYIGGDDGSAGIGGVEFGLRIVKRAGVFPGTRQMFGYPAPDDVGGINCPSGAGVGRWGWTCFHPVLFYGKRPSSALHPSTITSFDTAEKNGHPCPKPERWMRWLVNLCSLCGETVLDPFMGSGTTGVACVQLGRKFIGIEIEPKYFDIACKRIEEATRQGRLFDDPPPKAVQGSIEFEESDN